MSLLPNSSSGNLQTFPSLLHDLMLPFPLNRHGIHQILQDILLNKVFLPPPKLCLLLNQLFLPPPKIHRLHPMNLHHTRITLSSNLNVSISQLGFVLRTIPQRRTPTLLTEPYRPPSKS
ncbi:hypothetical protein Salat_1159200 [Sesamum alatum]|uniref:Uncharacterized protein n=1 Tax=Sesamum alatum TaxID=300844 RepID=A0AAE1YEF6_9LAMI|nr:hypothetical protein Salat_1159200 [Sesamum alatum]